jgi:hypothetical protein
MAKAETRPKAKEEKEKEEVTVSPEAHDAPGLSPYERMMELARRLVTVPPKELAKAKRRDEMKRGH